MLSLVFVCLTILMRVTNFYLRMKFVHAIRFRQYNGQCERCPLDWTIKVSVCVGCLRMDGACEKLAEPNEEQTEQS